MLFILHASQNSFSSDVVIVNIALNIKFSVWDQ
jgi:hypothetical protein